MDLRLGTLAALTPAVVLLGAQVPLFLPAVSILAPATAIAWAARTGNRSWLLAMVPGGLATALAGGGDLQVYACAALSGPLAMIALRLGQDPLAAIAWASGPFVARTLALAISGFQPFSAEFAESLDSLWVSAASSGDIPQESVAELRAASAAAVAALSKIWVTSETLSFALSLVFAYALVRKVFGGALPPFGRFTRFDPPDALVGALIGGLLCVVLGSARAPVLSSIGWNLILLAGFLFFVRGIAIEVFWMDRAELPGVARFGLLGGGVVLFLPVFVTATTAIGLFDAWFDFRRIRVAESRVNPLAPLRKPPAKDVNERE